MNPHGPAGRVLKPFIEQGFRDWVRAASSEPWFRKIFSVDKESDGTGYLYIGGKGGTKLPLDKGIAGLTAAAGLAHVTIANYPMLTWVVNEMIDEVGPALRDAYREGRTVSSDEMKDINDKLEKKFGKTRVRVLKERSAAGQPSKYYMHHRECYSETLDKPDAGDGGGGQKGRLVPVLEALAMKALPATHCEVCMTRLDSVLKDIKKIEEEKVAQEKQPKLSPAEVLMLIPAPARQRFDQLMAKWDKPNLPESEKLELDQLFEQLDKPSEALYLSTSPNLAEFKRRMRRTLAPKTVTGQTKRMFKQASMMFRQMRSERGEPTVSYADHYRQVRKNRPIWKRVFGLFRLL